MNTQTLQSWDHQTLWHPFTPMALWLKELPLIIEKGQGPYLFDTDGNRYLDGISSLWCNVHGHNHPLINEAIKKQLDKIAHSTLLGLSCPPAIELAKKLVEITPDSLSRVFYSDSGATSVEIALKIAFQYWRNLNQPKRKSFIALRQAYHGDTIGSVSVGGMDIFHRIFGPLTFPALFAPSPHPYRFDGSEQQCLEHHLKKMDQLLNEHQDKIAAIILEPLVQGAAGIIVHPAGFLKGVSELARKYDTLLITDEVATGFGRTGKMFACENENVQPDILCMAKGITAGYLPLAATLTSETIFQTFLQEPSRDHTFYHGHTYTGNALACAAGLASLEVFDIEKTLDKLPEKINLLTNHLNQISQLDHVGNTRQKGMIAGVELVRDKKTKEPFPDSLRLGDKLCHALRPQGIILRPLGDTLVLFPPLAITSTQLNEILTTLKNTLQKKLPSLIKHPT